MPNILECKSDPSGGLNGENWVTNLLHIIILPDDGEEPTSEKHFVALTKKETP
jgi:hypothetical protein